MNQQPDAGWRSVTRKLTASDNLYVLAHVKWNKGRDRIRRFFRGGDERPKDSRSIRSLSRKTLTVGLQVPHPGKKIDSELRSHLPRRRPCPVFTRLWGMSRLVDLRRVSERTSIVRPLANRKERSSIPIAPRSKVENLADLVSQKACYLSHGHKVTTMC